MVDDLIQNKAVCLIYSSKDPFTSFVQMFLAFLALLSLYVKRQLESPRRKFNTWFLDVSKQGIGACYIHLLNMILAVVLSGLTGVKLADQCAWYAITFLAGMTFGLLLTIAWLRLLDYAANKWDWETLKNSGVYHGDTALRHWFFQLIAWLIIITFVKCAEFYLLWLTSYHLARIGQFLFAPFQSNIRLELVFVMIFFPGVLNALYFWIVDSWLKDDTNSPHSHEIEEAGVLVNNDSSQSVDVPDFTPTLNTPLISNRRKPNIGSSQQGS